MWLIISFDLPTVTPKQRKVYTVFRKNLLKDGFFMHQFSVYVRHCASFQHAETYINRVEKYIPKEGHVSIMQFTDKQFSMIKNYWGYGRSQPERFGQLTMFTEQTELQIK
ncbi:MAG: CRISPR-associated endonuclease Cas2 [Candidatus Kapaibacterium sp.]